MRSSHEVRIKISAAGLCSRTQAVTEPHQLSDARSDMNAGLSPCAWPHLLVATSRHRVLTGRHGDRERCGSQVWNASSKHGGAGRPRMVDVLLGRP